MTARGKTLVLALVLIGTFVVLRIAVPTLAGWIIALCVGWSMCCLADLIVRRLSAPGARR